jgi:hypothetical protein
MHEAARRRSQSQNELTPELTPFFGLRVRAVPFKRTTRESWCGWAGDPSNGDCAPARDRPRSLGGGCLLFATLRSGACSQFSAHSKARLEGRSGLKPVGPVVASSVKEQNHSADAPDGWIAEDFNRVLQFVPDGFYEIAVRLPRVDPDLEQSVWTGDRHRH